MAVAISTLGVRPLRATVAAPTPIAQAVGLLDLVPTGRQILDRAQALWAVDERGDLLRFLKTGKASRTDAVLTRHFNPATQQETRSRDVSIYLREGATLGDTILDLAHELVHATTRPAWDPYDPTLTAGKYIQNAIDGEGGEVSAVLLECKVARELARLKPELVGMTAQSRCAAYWASGDRIDMEAVQKDFYRVGRWYATLRQKLGSEFSELPMISQAPPRLYSSTGASPYPVALYEEFTEMTRVACANTRRRVTASAERSPASTEQFLASRCR
jgi:hypothetical protein